MSREWETPKPFVETNYQLSKQMKDTVLGSQHRIVDSEGEELICGACHKALENGSKRKSKWHYFKDTKGIAWSQFLSALNEFPVYVCTVCHRTLFSHSVHILNLASFDMNNSTVCECLSTNIRKKSEDGNEYICMNCQKELKGKNPKMPSQAVANKLELQPQVNILKDLTTLERRCIGLNIPFMTIKTVRLQGKKMKGPCVNVPARLEPICSMLPRLPQEMQTVLVKLKRRLHYDGSYMFDYIHPQKVWTALLWLKAHNPLYKDVTINHKWFEEVEPLSENYFDIVKDPDAGEINGSFCESMNYKLKKKEQNIPKIKVEIENHSEEENKDVVSDSDEDFWEEQEAADLRAKVTVQPSSTCVQIENFEEAIFSIAPGEGSIPKLILTDEQLELVCFPDFFPEGKGAFHCPEHPIHIQLRRYVNQQLLNVDGRFARNLEYIFSMQYAVELKQLETDRNVFI